MEILLKIGNSYGEDHSIAKVDAARMSEARLDSLLESSP
jgi:hypothetical protein